MKNFLQENWFKVGTLVILGVLTITAFYFVLFIAPDLEGVSLPFDDPKNFTYGEIDKYKVYVLQVGGVGSRYRQVDPFSGSPYGYLKPPEKWAGVYFNIPASLMYVDCVEGYEATSCTVNGESSNNIEKNLGCRAGIKNQMQNTVVIDCKKSNY